MIVAETLSDLENLPDDGVWCCSIANKYSMFLNYTGNNVYKIAPSNLRIGDGVRKMMVVAQSGTEAYVEVERMDKLKCI